jgi:hypothetical protein
MNSEHIQTILDTTPEYDEARDNTLRTMLSEFYNRKMTSIVILVLGMGLTFMGAGILSLVLFFRTDDIRFQIFYAIMFLMFMQFLGMMKIFAWQMIHRNSLKREIKRLEIRLQDISDRLNP